MLERGRHIFFFLFLTAISCVAQKDIFQLQHITVKDGLPNGNAHDILQDKNSFIWISTPGSLTRYDGYHFKNYDASFFSINESATLSLALDNGNKIWFCERLPYSNIRQSGVFDPETDTIYDFEDFSKGLFRSQDVAYLNASKNEENVIFIGTKNGEIYRYDNQFTKIAKLPILPGRIVVCESDGDGGYWVAFNDTEIVQVNKHQQISASYNIGQPNYIIRKIVATAPFLVVEAQESDNIKRYWQIKENVLQSYTMGQETAFQLLHMDKSKSLFFKNDTVFERSVQESSLANKDIIIAKIPDLSCNTSFYDKQGVLWISSASGIHKIVSKKNPFTIIDPGSSTRGLYELDAALLIGSYAENATFNLKSKELTPLKGTELTLSHFIEDDKTNLWAGTMVDWLYKYNGTANRWTAIKNTTIDALLVPFQNPVTKKVWIGTGKGLSYVDVTETIVAVALHPEIDKAQIRQFLYEPAGIWIVTNVGLFVMDPQTEIIKTHYNKTTGLPNTNINHIHKDKDGIIWLATKTDGLVKWNVEANTFKTFTQQNGLSNNTLYAVYEDDYENLWLPSNYGLMRFDKTSNETQVFTTEDGIADNEFNTLSHFRGKDGTLYFGGIRGITAFHPKDLIGDIEEKNPVYLSSLKILGKNKENFNDPSSTPKLDGPIQLNHNDQLLELEVNLLDYTSVAGHVYAYRIDGYHANWNYIPSNKISIFNFPYGEHNIRVKAKSYSGRWTNEELVIPIHVKKPFYLEWYYIALFLLAILLLSYLGIAWRIKSLKDAKLRLEQEVSNRTQQIEKDKRTIELQAEDLKALDLAKGRFFSNITHEFRTPLTLIIGPLEQILENPPKTEVLKTKASGILKSAKQILTLINQLLDITKLESQQIPIELVNADIVSYTEELVKGFEPLCHQKSQELTFSSEKPKWTIDFDNDKWDKIVNNLISNAIKFTPESGRIKVVLNAIKIEVGESVELVVTDSGIGIEPKDKDAIFNRFYQVDFSSTRQSEGTGIGLALVKELVDLQNGTIIVTSEMGKGTTFCVTLPIVTNSESKSEKQIIPITVDVLPVVAKEPLTSPLTLPKLDILVVEDNAEIRDYICECLGRHNYVIATANDGEEGLEKALMTIPDLIISDIMMPKKNGFELVADIRKDIRTSHIPIIILTAKTALDSKLQGLKRGADAYLTKPFNPKELQVRVQGLIEMRAQLQKQYINKQNDTETGFEQEDAFILELRKHILENLNRPDLNGDTIGLHFGLSRIHLYRKLKALTNVSISEFVKNIRLETALEMVVKKKMFVSEIAYETGFTSVSHFSRSFKEKYGKSPSQM